MQGNLAPIDWLNQYIHLITWPALLAVVSAFLWRTRGSIDKFFKQVEMDRANIASTVALATAIKATVDTTQNNHLAHVADDLAEQKELQLHTVEVLNSHTQILTKMVETSSASLALMTSMDKNIAVLVDRSRPN